MKKQIKRVLKRVGYEVARIDPLRPKHLRGLNETQKRIVTSV